MWRRVRGELRRYLLRRFPYGIIYHAATERIFVLVVMHLRREPDYWLGRIVDIQRSQYVQLMLERTRAERLASSKKKNPHLDFSSLKTRKSNN